MHPGELRHHLFVAVHRDLARGAAWAAIATPTLKIAIGALVMHEVNDRVVVVQLIAIAGARHAGGRCGHASADAIDLH